MNQTQYQNIEERGSSVDIPNISKRKMLYVVNFTPLRLFVFSVSSLALIIFIFVLGFHLGGSKPDLNNNRDSDARALLMREGDNPIASSSLVPGSEVENNLNTTPDIASNLSMQTMSKVEPSSEIVRENAPVENKNVSENYNEYTQNLALELSTINESIKKGGQIKTENPNTTYTPPKQNVYVESPTIEPKTSALKEASTVTKTPYTKDLSSGNLVYFIQVAVGYDKKNSYEARDILKKRFPKVFIKEEMSSLDAKMMYKLKIGRYETRDEAQKVLSEIRKISAYKDSYIYTDKK